MGKWLFSFLLLKLWISQAAALDIKVHHEVLENGLQVLIHHNPQAPVVACRIFYVTGSVHEKPGNSGLTHMVEHMLFKGTRKVGIKDSVADVIYLRMQDSLQGLIRPLLLRGDTAGAAKWQAEHDSLVRLHREIFIKDELWESYQQAGGTDLNAFTTDLMTAYFVTLPRNRMELFLWLESDRMQNAVFRDFYAERDVVREERRTRTDDTPTGRYRETLRATFYEAFPYRIPTIGWPSDIMNLTREMAQDHYRRYYKPNNAILVFVGDVHAQDLMPQVRRYFGAIPRGEDFPPITLREPEQVAEKRIIQRRNDAQPQLDILFHTPAVGHMDLYALDIVEGVLSGRSGRLHRRLVQDEKLAVSVSASNTPNKYISSFSINVRLRQGADPARVESLVWEELEKLMNTQVNERELQKVRNQTYGTLVRSLTGIEHVATMLAWYQMFGDWKMLTQWPERINAVEAAQIQDVAKRYFLRRRSTTGMLLPELAPAPVPEKK